MTNQTTKTKAATTKKAGAKGNGQPESPKEPKEDLVVFAFRLTAAERELLHKAAGPAKASRYVRTLAVAAASGDKARVEQLVNVKSDPVT